MVRLLLWERGDDICQCQNIGGNRAYLHVTLIAVQIVASVVVPTVEQVNTRIAV